MSMLKEKSKELESPKNTKGTKKVKIRCEFKYAYDLLQNLALFPFQQERNSEKSIQLCKHYTFGFLSCFFVSFVDIYF